MSGEHLDLSSDPGSTAPEQSASVSGNGAKNYLGVRFDCCHVYARIYVNRERTAYQGHCPRCARAVTIRIGAEGTDARFFAVQ